MMVSTCHPFPQLSKLLPVISLCLQDGVDHGAVSRTDIAEVVVRSLLDPRACNVACTVSESDTTAPSMYEQDISKALEVLEPNRP